MFIFRFLRVFLSFCVGVAVLALSTSAPVSAPQLKELNLRRRLSQVRAARGKPRRPAVALPPVHRAEQILEVGACRCPVLEFRHGPPPVTRMPEHYPSIVKLTIETNALIDLETGAADAPFIRAIADGHGANDTTVAIAGISASEAKRGGGHENTFSAFQARLAAIGLDHLEILRPAGVWGMVYWDWFILVDAEMVDLERRIHEVLFPTIPYDYEKFCAKKQIPTNDDLDPRWRNARCDSLGLWCHIHYERDVFVTRDRNFHKATKRRVLEEQLGARRIVLPSDAMALVLA